MGTHITDPPKIIIDPAPDAAQRLRRLSQLLLGNSVPPAGTEGTAAPIPPAMTGKETDASEPYPWHGAGST